MRQPIRQLSSYVASLIAAGEIIKRPEDIVRELVDNSLDAGATQIKCSLTQGGLETIKIIDNGLGISKDELSLALNHHTTSKIRHIEDIEKLHTLGFRGEALASIRAVARIQLSSRTEDGIHGWEIISEPGQPVSTPRPVAHPIGTTIVITELFYHIPARRNFLRSPGTELARIQQWVKSLSLSHSHVELTLEHNKRPLLQYPILEKSSDTQLSRLASLYSPDFAAVAIPIDKSDTKYTLSGWISPPSVTRHQSDWQNFYVNGRLIKDKALNHAIKQAYQDLLYRDRQPAVALFLKLHPSHVDMNVHPTKAEVRFRETRFVHDFVYKCIKQALNKHKQTLESQSYGLAPHPSLLEKDEHPLLEPTYRENHPIAAAAPQLKEGALTAVDISDDLLNESHQPSTEKTVTAFQTILPDNALRKKEFLGYALAQLHTAYILSQNDQGLIIVDAHAAHERVLYEQLKQALAQRGPSQQKLLIPLTLSVTPVQSELMDLYHASFVNMGFEIEKSTPTQWIVKTVPSILAHATIERLIYDVLYDLQENNLSQRLEKEQNRLLATIACRKATHANRAMSLHEMNQLLRYIETTPHSGQCNHGRPTWRYISLTELDSWFLRGR